MAALAGRVPGAGSRTSNPGRARAGAAARAVWSEEVGIDWSTIPSLAGTCEVCRRRHILVGSRTITLAEQNPLGAAKAAVAIGDSTSPVHRHHNVQGYHKPGSSPASARSCSVSGLPAILRYSALKSRAVRSHVKRETLARPRSIRRLRSSSSVHSSKMA